MSSARPTTPLSVRLWPRPRPDFRPGRQRRSMRAPPCSNVPPTGSRSTAAASSRCCRSEAGKTLDDALAELREAVDYCRYYAAQARIALVPQPMPGPTGESNELRYRGRGVFVCISPWNFPLAIFLGQVTAALVAGNTVVAKPAEQTPLIAALAVALLHEAGVPASALHLVPGDGAVGASLVADPRVAGVAFTGSTETGRAINRALAGKNGADRAADRRDRRHQRHDRRCHGVARTGDRRRRHVGIPLRRPALLGAAAVVPARRCRRAPCSTC